MVQNKVFQKYEIYNCTGKIFGKVSTFFLQTSVSVRRRREIATWVLSGNITKQINYKHFSLMQEIPVFRHCCWSNSCNNYEPFHIPRHTSKFHAPFSAQTKIGRLRNIYISTLYSHNKSLNGAMVRKYLFQAYPTHHPKYKNRALPQKSAWIESDPTA